MNKLYGAIQIYIHTVWESFDTNINQFLLLQFRPRQPIIEVPDADFVCVRDTRSIVIGVSTLAGSLVLLMATILGIYKFRGEIKVMLYFKLGWRPFDQSDDTDILNKVRLFFCIWPNITQIVSLKIYGAGSNF